MQETTHGSQPKGNKIPVMEFDVEEFDFKPLTKGLGFHNKESDTRPSSRAYSRPSSIGQSRTRNSVNTPIKRPAPQSEIGKTEEISFPELKKEKTPKTKVVAAPMGVLFTAFVFDLIILLSFQTSINFGFMKIVELDNLVNFIKFTWVEQVAFFTFIYMFYFTIMDLIASPGKKIFSLRLKSTSSKKVTIDQTLIRSVVSLCSFILLLMPLLFDFQGKLSDTKVIEDAQ